MRLRGIVCRVKLYSDKREFSYADWQLWRQLWRRLRFSNRQLGHQFRFEFRFEFHFREWIIRQLYGWFGQRNPINHRLSQL